MSVEVYIAQVDPLYDKKLFNALYKNVSDYRKTKIDQLKFEKDKCLSLGVELLFKKALSDFGIEYSNTEMELGEYGKPHLKSNRNFHFNLSHSGEAVMCAAFNKPIGCDVQKVIDCKVKSVANLLTDSEREIIFSRKTSNEQKDMFCRIWTLKESFVKMTGTGLTLPLDSFQVIPSDDKIENNCREACGTVAFSEINRNDGYRYSVCYQPYNADTNICVKKININNSDF